jgi:hypothetical protein
MFNSALKEAEMEVFYDKDEEHRILANDVEEYLAPIYRSEARFVIALLSKNYPRKIWTKFESDNFKQRFGQDSVIPIWFADAPPGMFDESAKVGGILIDPAREIHSQVDRICETLVRKAGEERQAEQRASEERKTSSDDV